MSTRTSVLLVLVTVLTATSSAGPKTPPKSLTSVWVGVFVPAPAVARCTDCKAASFRAATGSVRVLAPSNGAPGATGDVLIVHPFGGLVVHGHVDNGAVALPWFDLDVRDGADGVLVMTTDHVVRFVVPTAPELAAIKTALLRDDVLAGVHKALQGLEVSAIDLDGDHKADLAITYGCNAWADGDCQSHGQFFLIRDGATWREIE